MASPGSPRVRLSDINSTFNRKDHREATYSHLRRLWTCLRLFHLSFAAMGPHHLEPSAPRTVTVTESATPPVIRAGLLQSTLILLPAKRRLRPSSEETRSIGSSMAAMWPVASSVSSRRSRTAQLTFTSSRTTATNTPFSCERFRARKIPTSIRRYSSPGDKAAKDKLVEMPVFVPAAELDKVKQEAANRESRGSAEREG